MKTRVSSRWRFACVQPAKTVAFLCGCNCASISFVLFVADLGERGRVGMERGKRLSLGEPRSERRQDRFHKIGAGNGDYFHEHSRRMEGDRQSRPPKWFRR